VDEAATSMHPTTEELEAGIGWVRQSPGEQGRLELIVRRPAVDERELLEEGTLSAAEGLVGDTWRHRKSSSTPDNSPSPDRQLTLMNSRVASLVARDDSRRPLAGDQLFVDFDLSIENLPAGTRLAIGEAVVEMTEPPHTGCAKFVSRFGKEAMQFVNSPLGRRLRLRGANAKVVVAGIVRVGDMVVKLPAEDDGPR
jgi:MOSC domain-containing protein YiiM